MPHKNTNTAIKFWLIKKKKHKLTSKQDIFISYNQKYSSRNKTNAAFLTLNWSFIYKQHVDEMYKTSKSN